MLVDVDDIEKRLEILTEGAKYDVSCSSSGSGRKAKGGETGRCHVAGLCHSFTADGRCISLLKLLMSNHCEYDCLYCMSRRSNDVPRARLSPEEICEVVMGFYRRNYIEGLFLSSAVDKSPTLTMQKLTETLILLRTVHKFRGYIHVKAIPGADAAAIEKAAQYADRMSVNIELPSESSLKLLAPQKKREAILAPMRQLSTYAVGRVGVIGNPYSSPITNPNMSGSSYAPGRVGVTGNPYSSPTTSITSPSEIIDLGGNAPTIAQPNTPHRAGGREPLQAEFDYSQSISSAINQNTPHRVGGGSPLPAGQTTQMIIGASGDSDGQIVRLSQALYRTYGLKRVYYSAYIPLGSSSLLPATPPDLRREHRLYEADWLMRFYGFDAEELVPVGYNLPSDVDPKCDWALRNIDKFPVEVNTAPYEMLLRVPGIGVLNAYRIAKAREHTTLTFDSLKKMRVVLKRAQYFITANGKFAGGCQMPELIRPRLAGLDSPALPAQQKYTQLTWTEPV